MTFVNISMAQNSCDKIIITETDKMTGSSFPQAKEAILMSKDGGVTGINMGIFLISEMIVLDGVALGDGSCIDQGLAIFLFRDGSKINVRLQNDFNCKNEYTIYIGGSLGEASDHKALMEKEVEAIRIPTKQGFVQEDLTQAQSKMIVDVIKCLSSDGKVSSN